ncbi:family 43 glycosylhydrolase [Terrimonas rubra]|uniref:Family 43 glycosylhydrolase n=1 Tax=Terrimonas rubra TaxID=1035890 RepID=A0ABW6ADM7_9BACT
MRSVILFCCGICSLITSAQTLPDHQQPGKGNPVIPGYFADPTIKQIGDTYYLYATTDGNGGGLGPSQVWTSKDFVNWKIQPMNWPNTHWYWAPDMTKGYDGRYYLYYSQPVELYGAVANSPVGPWTPLLPGGKAMVPNYMIPGVITLDGQTFTDDDGKIYMYWGTWGIYPDHGCAVGLLNKDMTTFEKTALIPNTVAKDFFEAPYMFKRKGVYYMMYSSGHCEDHTYRVQYVKSTKGPMGPFEYPKHNPILVTNDDGTIHGPGHHSILQKGEDYYIVYHRHNNPHSGGGFHRQVAIDKIEFDANGDIKNIVPTHEGAGWLGTNTIPQKDIAFGKPVIASSYYNDDFRPSFAVDNNNGTLWRAADNGKAAWLQIDLGNTMPVQTIHTQFEYPTYYYQYKIEYSVDSINWSLFADRSANLQWGSPFIDKGKATARYIRLHINHTQLAGLAPAVWNIKVFSEANVGGEEILSEPQKATAPVMPQGLLVDINANEPDNETAVTKLVNKGKLQGAFNLQQGKAYTGMIDGKQGIWVNGATTFLSDFKVPASLSGNSSFTVAAWLYNPDISRYEPFLSWSQGNQDLTRAVFGYGADKGQGAIAHGAWPDVAYKNLPAAGQWQQITYTFDGYWERIYVNGKEVQAAQKMLFVKAGEYFSLGGLVQAGQFFSGALHRLQVYDQSLTAVEVQNLFQQPTANNIAVDYHTASLPYGNLTQWKNNGFTAGEIILKGDHQVKEHHSRLALVSAAIPEIISTTAGRQLQNYDALTIEMELSPISKKSAWLKLLPKDAVPGKWYHLTAVQDKTHTRFFVNGEFQLVTGETIAAKFNELFSKEKLTEVAVINIGLGTPQRYSFNTKNKATDNTVAITRLTVYNETLSPATIKQHYQNRVQTTNEALTRSKAVFDVKPVNVNGNTVFMRAAMPAVPVEGLSYLFMEPNSNWQSGWQSQPYVFFEQEGHSVNAFTVMTKDRYGNISQASLPVAVSAHGLKIKPTSFTTAQPADWSKSFTSNDFWSGLIHAPADSILLKAYAGNDSVFLGSAASKWDGSAPIGPFIYKEVKGDFLLQAEIADLSGLQDKKASANEVGLMVRSSTGKGRRTEQLLQNTVLTGWNIGNISTDLKQGQRLQENRGNGWSFHRYLQILKQGDYFYMRSSADGKTWSDMPGSPFLRKDMAAQESLQVGLFQASNNNLNGYGYGVFKNIQLIQLSR